jgi:SAM-dependent methyltransferase
MLEAGVSLGSEWICIKCKADQLYRTARDEIICGNCAAQYPIVDGVPVFVGDSEAHKAHMDKSLSEKREWYWNEQILGKNEDPWHDIGRRRYAALSDMLRAYVPKGKPILDLGCGDGRNLQLLKTVASGVTGTDYNLLRLQRAKGMAEGYESLCVSEVNALPFCDCSWDIVYFDQVLEHMPDPGQALESVHRILRHHGVLILGVPNEGCWYHQLKFRIKPSLLKKTDHVNFFTEKSIRALVERCGFAVKRTMGMTWGLPATGDGVLGPMTKVDRALRRYVWYNSVWERLGRVFLPGQYFELYLACIKVGDSETEPGKKG